MADKRFGAIPTEKLLPSIYGALQAEAFNRRLMRDGLPDETPLQQMVRERWEEREARRLGTEDEAQSASGAHQTVCKTEETERET